MAEVIAHFRLLSCIKQILVKNTTINFVLSTLFIASVFTCHLLYLQPHGKNKNMITCVINKKLAHVHLSK